MCEWEEHDTWVNGTETGLCRLECEECAARYDSSWDLGQVWVPKEDKRRVAGLESMVKEKLAELRRIVVERYEEAFVSHVLQLRNRTAMKYALRVVPVGFLKNAKDNPSYVEQVARESIREHPREALGVLRVGDAEVSRIMTEIDSLKKEVGELRNGMTKIPAPDRWGNVRTSS